MTRSVNTTPIKHGNTDIGIYTTSFSYFSIDNKLWVKIPQKVHVVFHI